MIQQSHKWAYIQIKHSFKRYMHPYVHHCPNHNSQGMETTYMPPADKWIKKKYAVYIQWETIQP